MEIQSLRLHESADLSQHVTQSTTFSPGTIIAIQLTNISKIDLASSNSTVPGQDSNFLSAIYGYVGPSIVTFGLIGNLLILLVVGRSSMTGKFLFTFRH